MHKDLLHITAESGEMCRNNVTDKKGDRLFFRYNTIKQIGIVGMEWGV